MVIRWYNLYVPNRTWSCLSDLKDFTKWTNALQSRSTLITVQFLIAIQCTRARRMKDFRHSLRRRWVHTCTTPRHATCWGRCGPCLLGIKFDTNCPVDLNKNNSVWRVVWRRLILYLSFQNLLGNDFRQVWLLQLQGASCKLPYQVLWCSRELPLEHCLDRAMLLFFLSSLRNIRVEKHTVCLLPSRSHCTCANSDLRGDKEKGNPGEPG